MSTSFDSKLVKKFGDKQSKIFSSESLSNKEKLEKMLKLMKDSYRKIRGEEMPEEDIVKFRKLIKKNLKKADKHNKKRQEAIEFCEKNIKNFSSLSEDKKLEAILDFVTKDIREKIKKDKINQS